MTEIRLIDPREESRSFHHAGVSLGTATIVRPRRGLDATPAAPATNPFRFLILRALRHHAGEAGPTPRCLTARPSQCADRILPSSPATNPTRGKTSGPKGVLKDGAPRRTRVLRKVLRDDAGSHTPNGAGKAALIPYKTVRGREDSRLSVGLTALGKSPAPDSQLLHDNWTDEHSIDILKVFHHAGRLGTDSFIGSTPKEDPGECQSAPQPPAPYYCVNNGTPIRVNQNAEAAEGHFLQKYPGNHPHEVVSSTSARPAPRTQDDGADTVGPACSPVGRRLRSLIGFFRKLAVKIEKRSAYECRDKIRTNFGWVRRDVLEKRK